MKYFHNKILIVEDEKELSLDYERVLQHEKFDTKSAYDGEQAVVIALEWKPDLILIDINLPIINGFEVLKILKKERLPTRIIMISGVHIDVPTIVKSIKYGACDFLKKPINKEELVKRVKRQIILENALNIIVSDVQPSVDKMLTSAEALKRENEDLKKNIDISDKKLRNLSIKLNYINYLVRIISVTLSSIIVWAMFKLGLISGSINIIILTIALVFLFLFPLEKVSRLHAKYRNSETTLDIEKIER